MRAITGKFIFWLMSLTTLMRYFVIAILFHVLILCIFGSIKLVSRIPIIAGFTGDLPSPLVDDKLDTYAVLRQFEYSGPSLGSSGGTPGTGAGGTPTAAGSIKSEYHASIIPNNSAAADGLMTEIISVVGGSATTVGRLSDSNIGGLASPAAGFGNGTIGTSGIQGPGGSNFGQRQGPLRAQLLRDGHASKETERAVVAALRWLKEHQESDGAWSPQSYPAAKTGLAALCFLGHGETADSEEFGPTINKALGYLVTVVGEDGVVKSHNMYEQGIVTLALAEAYGMTQSPLAREPLERAVNAILLSQKAKKTSAIHVGGWRYSPNSADSDTSVAGWNIMGLKSAKLAGLPIPEESLEAASQYIWNMAGPDGGFGYVGPGAGNATTAVGILCEQFLGHADDKRLQKSLDFYMKQKVNWENPSNTLYGWYYATQAMFQAGDARWDYWNHEIRDTLVKAQAADGHWDEPGPANNTKEPVYSTTLCCLMLEVYYRYLPTHQEREHNTMPSSPGERASAK